MKSLLCLFLFDFLISVPLDGQIKGEVGRNFLISFGFSKSIYSTPDQGLSLDSYVWMPDVEVGMYTNTTRLAFDYRHYYALYPIRYAEGDIEERKFSVFDLTYHKQLMPNSRKYDISVGGGFSLRLLKELIISEVSMTSGGWYEIFTDQARSHSLGIVVRADCRYDLTRRVYIEASLSYNAYLNSYNMGRMGLSVGYYLRRGKGR